VEKTLNAMQGSGCRDFNPPIATISMENPSKLCIFKNCFQLGNYSIKVFNPNDALLPTEEVTIAPPKNAAGKYYCPMFCEDDKVYDEAGDCPVCGMDLVQAPDLTPAKTMYTCPMHPEIIQEGRVLSHLRNGFSTYGT
jgi:Cu2+-exporting ATPase